MLFDLIYDQPNILINYRIIVGSIYHVMIIFISICDNAHECYYYNIYMQYHNDLKNI
jgi:hypothetical protein